MNSGYQGKLTLSKTGDDLAIRVEGGHLELRHDEDGTYTLMACVGDDTVEVGMEPAAMQTLALQCAMYFPQLAPQHTVASVEEAYRLPARFIREMDNRSLQLLLREVESDELTTFLWYMKDAELIRKICRNLSQRAAEMLVDDLSQQWQGQDPDTALDAQAGVGRAAVLHLLSLVRRLADEGRIPNYYGVI